MEKKQQQWVCLKDLYMRVSQEKVFSENKVYTGYTDLRDSIVVMDDKNDEHFLDEWAIHFKLIKDE